MSSLEGAGTDPEEYGIDPSTLDQRVPCGAPAFISLALVEFLLRPRTVPASRCPTSYSNIDTLAGLAAVVDNVQASQAA